MTLLSSILVFVGIVIVVKNIGRNREDAFESVSTITSIFYQGFSLTGGLRATTREVAYKNVLVIGPSGSGKTSTVLIASLNSIARGNSSMAILDVSGEIYTLMSGYLSKSHKIYCIDFSRNSDGFNPIDGCKTPSDTQKLAATLIKNSGTESKSDPYWSASAEGLINIFLQYLINYVEPEYRSLSNLERMIQVFAGEPEKIDRCFAKTSGDLLSSYKGLIAGNEKTLQSTVSSALIALKLFKNPEVARCTSKTTFDLARFRKEKSVLFINVPVYDVHFYAPFSAILFEELFKVILSKIPEKSDCGIYCCLDEMVSMKFDNLGGKVFSQIRKFRGGCMGIIQDERMLEMAVSAAEAHAIRTNSYSKVYLPGQPHATCKMLEEVIGKDEQNKPVHTAAQIRQLEEAIILCGNKKPFKEKMIPFYNHWILSSRTKYPPYKMTRRIDFDTPPVLEF